MAGFRKAQAEQAAVKLGIYGPSGSGKTFTSLLVAEGLAKQTGKRIAYVDTERGTDFYCKAVPERPVHPEAFDFDALYTRSITEVISAVKSLSPDEYGVVVIDSITHLWEACINAYSGKSTRAGTIPMHAWGKIKKPYKDLINLLLSSPMHVIFCGRQANEYEIDSETEEMKRVGVKMKAEGETAYEPHVLLRMESVRPEAAGETATIQAFVEKDRTGVLAGTTLVSPNFESIGGPILRCLGHTQAVLETDDETAHRDAEAIEEETWRVERASLSKRRELIAKIDQARTTDELKLVGNEITPEAKEQMSTDDLKHVRTAYLQRMEVLKERAAAAPKKPAAQASLYPTAPQLPRQAR